MTLSHLKSRILRLPSLPLNSFHQGAHVSSWVFQNITSLFFSSASQTRLYRHLGLRSRLSTPVVTQLLVVDNSRMCSPSKTANQTRGALCIDPHCIKSSCWTQCPCWLLKLSADGDMGCVCLDSPSAILYDCAKPCLQWVVRKGRLRRFPERWEGLQPHFLPALPVDVLPNIFVHWNLGIYVCANCC